VVGKESSAIRSVRIMFDPVIYGPCKNTLTSAEVCALLSIEINKMQNKDNTPKPN